MAKNLELGIHRTLLAKFKEKGMSESLANTTANDYRDAALAYFNGRMAEYGAPSEESYDKAFADLTEWANQI